MSRVELVDALRRALESRSRVRVAAIAPDTALFVDIGAMLMATCELVDNAVQFGAPDTGLTVRVRGGGTASVSVEGGESEWPVPPEDAIDPLYTTKGQELGLGLAIAHAVASSHGGRLRIDPERSRVEITCEGGPES